MNGYNEIKTLKSITIKKPNHKFSTNNYKKYQGSEISSPEDFIERYKIQN